MKKLKPAAVRFLCSIAIALIMMFGTGFLSNVRVNGQQYDTEQYRRSVEQGEKIVQVTAVVSGLQDRVARLEKSDQDSRDTISSMKGMGLLLGFSVVGIELIRALAGRDKNSRSSISIEKG